MMLIRSVARGFALGLFASAAWLAAGDAAEFRELPNFHPVNAMLYRGGRPKVGGLKIIAGLGIKTDIDLQPEADPGNSEAAEAQAAGLRYFNVPLASIGRPEMADVEKVLALINDPANQPAFIHCKRGADRTGTIIAVYRISHDGWNADAAIAEAKRYDMGWWQRAMRAFIRDYAAANHPATPVPAQATPAPASSPAPVVAPTDPATSSTPAVPPALPASPPAAAF